ncbi:homeobox protein unc-4 homolog isoform X2 [Neopelma chrysocephalum]|uniref:homeobox protein unc-4 homolog isoform X2 n=1 Tax=Neopelma chrysocephalum TaxID=114329 RepID=UPI000FCCE707|nr:homeobox protein unc-4 homolog isoform X2 [Neopelma chrysocephalum]
MSGVGGPAEAEGFSPCQAPTLQTKVFQYRLWDVNQKSLYLRDDQLLAGHLQGANAALEGDEGARGGMWGWWGTLTLILMAPRVCDPPREGVLGAQPRLRAHPAPRHPGHPQRHPLPHQPPQKRHCPGTAAAGRGHPGAAPHWGGLGRLHLLPLLQGRAVALRVRCQPRLVPLHLCPGPPAPGTVPQPRCHPPARLLLPALLSPPGTAVGTLPTGNRDVLSLGTVAPLPGQCQPLGEGDIPPQVGDILTPRMVPAPWRRRHSTGESDTFTAGQVPSPRMVPSPSEG